MIKIEYIRNYKKCVAEIRVEDLRHNYAGMYGAGRATCDISIDKKDYYHLKKQGLIPFEIKTENTWGIGAFVVENVSIRNDLEIERKHKEYQAKIRKLKKEGEFDETNGVKRYFSKKTGKVVVYEQIDDL